VGITYNIARRAAEQPADKDIDISSIDGLEDLSRADARSVEQVLIEEYGGPKGGQLINQINSIATSNPVYSQSIQRGCELLAAVGYPATSARRLKGASMAPLKPGLAFSLVSDLGFAVGLMTHRAPRTGHLVWIAEPTLDEEPGLEDVAKIDRWRWPVFFPLGPAIRRELVTPIGVIGVPPALAAFPTLRSGAKGLGWTAFTETDGVRRRFGPTNNPSLPIYKVVNDTRLKEMIVSGWRPEQEW
jgi:hypothetical protein